MERINFENVNEVFLTGPVVRKNVNEVACNFTIKTQKMNMPNVTREGESSYDYLEVSFYGELKDEIATTYEIGDEVSVIATIHPYRKKNNETDQLYTEIRLIGTMIKQAPKLLMKEFGYDEGDFVDSENKIRLGGTISRIYAPTTNVLRINIRTFINGHVNNIQTVYYDKNVGKYLDSLKVGDQVFAVGYLRTSTRKVEENTDKKNKGKNQNKHTKDIVLKAICKAK